MFDLTLTFYIFSGIRISAKSARAQPQLESLLVKAGVKALHGQEEACARHWPSSSSGCGVRSLHNTKQF